MGLLDKFRDKFKDIFTEAPEEEEPIKKELTQVEIPSPASRDEDDSLISESELMSKEERPQTPIFFDDKDFDTLEKPKEKKLFGNGTFNNKPTRSEEKKNFQLSPIISPVYGVLDKNYHKEDITDKANPSNNSYGVNKPMSIDDVRKKAFGTLEDDIETDLFGQKSILFNDETEVVKDTQDKDIFDELDFNLDGVLDATETEKPALNLDYVIATNLHNEEDDDHDKHEHHEDKHASNNMIEEELTKLVADNDLKEDDLFNLIDSMYEKREDE